MGFHVGLLPAARRPAVVVVLVEGIPEAHQGQGTDDELPGVVNEDGGEEREHGVAHQLVVAMAHGIPFVESEGGFTAVEAMNPPVGWPD